MLYNGCEDGEPLLNGVRALAGETRPHSARGVRDPVEHLNLSLWEIQAAQCISHRNIQVQHLCTQHMTIAA